MRRNRWVAPIAGIVLALGLAACTGEPPRVRTAPVNAPAPSAAPGGTTAGITAAPRITVVATGDVLLHPALWEQARTDGGGRLDFGPMLAGVRPYISGADLAICHLETPLAGDAGPFRGYPDFSGPPQIVPALRRTGYDACSTASNHTFDQGAAGVDRTLAALDRAGLAHTGSARTPAEARRITTVTVRGVRIALLAYTYGFNGHAFPGGQRWRANVIDPDRIRADAARARKAGADLVLLSLHWGTEYSQEPSAQQRELAPELAGAVDLVISHHAHVVEPLRRIGRTWVVYGLGNLLAAHSTPGPANEEGLLARFTFTRGPGGRWSTTAAEYLPLLMTQRPPMRLLAVPQALADGTGPRARLQQAERRTRRVVTSLDGDRQGLREISADDAAEDVETPSPAPTSG